MQTTKEAEHSIERLILDSTKRVVERAEYVRIRRDQLNAFAKRVPASLNSSPTWDMRHFSDKTQRTAQWVFVLDALNFSFWPDREENRWCVEWNGEMMNGYWALACSLRKAIESGVRITDADFLENVDVPTLRSILDGTGKVPMIAERVANLNEAGKVLRQSYDGSFANLLEEAGGSAVRTIRLITEAFSSFNDVAVYAGEKVYFYKRPQILVSDIWGAFSGTGLGHFSDIGELTAFADYRLPQLLRALSILEYAPSLAERVDNLIQISPGSNEEVEIRSATIWSVEELRCSLALLGRQIEPFSIDWWLWEISHLPAYEKRPHHRTRTIFY
jgi:Potential Queuosine, Q, salvage protein family